MMSRRLMMLKSMLAASAAFFRWRSPIDHSFVRDGRTYIPVTLCQEDGSEDWEQVPLRILDLSNKIIGRRVFDYSAGQLILTSVCIPATELKNGRLVRTITAMLMTLPEDGVTWECEKFEKLHRMDRHGRIIKTAVSDATAVQVEEHLWIVKVMNERIYHTDEMNDIVFKMRSRTKFE